MKPSIFLVCAAAVVAIAGCNSKQGDAATNTVVDARPVPPPKGGDWSKVVDATPAGGFAMGNPNAALKLIEFASLTCPHCREFDETGVQPLIDNYVKTGQLSYEFRNYVRDGFDLAGALVARCNGPQTFFPLSRALFKDQPNWMGKIQATPQDQLEALSNLPPHQQFLAVSKITGFQEFAAMRGVPVAKTNQCLTDENSINQLVQMTSDATDQYPDFPGTPTFILNGNMVEIKAGTPMWDQLKAAIDKSIRR
jgi:protein-disulfide isomerase